MKAVSFASSLRPNVLNQMTKINIEKIIPLFRTYPFIAAAYQYGSTVRGQEGPLSDLDITILVDEEQAPSGVELL